MSFKDFILAVIIIVVALLIFEIIHIVGISYLKSICGNFNSSLSTIGNYTCGVIK